MKCPLNIHREGLLEVVEFALNLNQKEITGSRHTE